MPREFFYWKFDPEGQIGNNWTFVEVMDWCRIGHKPSSEPKRTISLTQIWITGPQWVDPLPAHSCTGFEEATVLMLLLTRGSFRYRRWVTRSFTGGKQHFPSISKMPTYSGSSCWDNQTSINIYIYIYWYVLDPLQRQFIQDHLDRINLEISPRYVRNVSIIQGYSEIQHESLLRIADNLVLYNSIP